MSKFNNIDKFFHKRKYHSDWCKYPVILRWLNKASMYSSVKIIDDDIGYLLTQACGISKIKEWFLGGNQQFVTTTAERYILNYLKSLNPTLIELFCGNDVDGSIEISGKEYGIEITCFLQTLAEWVIVERIQQYIYHHNITLAYGLTVSASLDTLQGFVFWRESDQCDLIEELLNSIQQRSAYASNGFSIIRDPDSSPGVISWEFEQNDADPFNDLLDSLTNKIHNKSSQLNKRADNILFISVGSMPINWLFPDLFSEMQSPDRWKVEVAELENKVKAIIKGSAVRGVCFYVYSIDQTNPFYPLKLITDDKKLINNLAL